MDKQNEKNIVLSSRIRFARNLAEYPFPNSISDAGAKEVIEKVKTALGDSYKCINFNDIDALTAQSYLERHLCSRDFLSQKIPHTLLLDNDNKVSVMICEEDHIRLQCITQNGLDEAYRLAKEADEKLISSLNIAFDKKLGFLTSCPTNLGTAMRASVMMFLPALSTNGGIPSLSSQLTKLGIVMRGLYGEGSESDGCLYQVSNQLTLGFGEGELIEKLSEIVRRICALESDAREGFRSGEMRDKACRALGTMKSAYLLSSDEFMSLYAAVRLGASLGYCEVDLKKLDMLTESIMPAAIALRCKGEGGEQERDRLRAQTVREVLQ